MIERGSQGGAAGERGRRAKPARPSARRIGIAAVACLAFVTLAALASGCGGSEADSAASLPPLSASPSVASSLAVGGSPAGAPATEAPSIAGGGLPAGCSCHSENPRLARMHGLFSPQDCEKCHADGIDPTAAGAEWTAARVAKLVERRRSEPICRECHRGE